MDEDTRQKAYYTVFRQYDFGVVVLNDLLDKFYKPTFLNGKQSIDDILLNCGGREVLVWILSQIEEYENRGRG